MTGRSASVATDVPYIVCPEYVIDPLDTSSLNLFLTTTLFATKFYSYKAWETLSPCSHHSLVSVVVIPCLLVNAILYRSTSRKEVGFTILLVNNNYYME